MQGRTPLGHSPFSVRPAPSAAALARLLHTFELAAVLEAHAVSRAAAAQSRDLQATHAAFAQLTRVLEARTIEARSRARWAGLEIQFHRALNDQSGNPVLASLAERTLRDSLRTCPIVSPAVLTILQSHHREILRCVEANDADAAVRHTRAHILYLRDVLVGAARGPRRTSRVRLQT